MIRNRVETVTSIGPSVIFHGGPFVGDYSATVNNDTHCRLFIGGRDVTLKSGIILAPGETRTFSGLKGGDDLYGLIDRARLRWWHLRKVDVQTDIRVMAVSRS